MEKIRKKITNRNVKKKIFFLGKRRINDDSDFDYNKIVTKISFKKNFFENKLA